MGRPLNPDLATGLNVGLCRFILSHLLFHKMTHMTSPLHRKNVGSWLLWGHRDEG